MPVSRPARGEWIEILMICEMVQSQGSRPARGEWIEIGNTFHHFHFLLRLAPRGASGLKFSEAKKSGYDPWSRPARGEWIEIFFLGGKVRIYLCLAPRGASGLKSTGKRRRCGCHASRPARGEWIEIRYRCQCVSGFARVSPREGRVN